MHLYGNSVSEIRENAKEEIIFIWKEFALGDPKNFSKGAKKLRRVLLKRISVVPHRVRVKPDEEVCK